MYLSTVVTAGPNLIFFYFLVDMAQSTTTEFMQENSVKDILIRLLDIASPAFNSHLSLLLSFYEISFSVSLSISLSLSLTNIF